MPSERRGCVKPCLRLSRDSAGGEEQKQPEALSDLRPLLARASTPPLPQACPAVFQVAQLILKTVYQAAFDTRSSRESLNSLLPERIAWSRFFLFPLAHIPAKMAALRQKTSKALFSAAETRPCTCRAHPPPLSSPSSRAARFTTSTRRHPAPTPRPQLSLPARPSPLPDPSPPRRFLATHTARPGPTSAYNELVASGLIQDDEYQRGIVSRLQSMHDDLEAYEPPAIPEGTDAPTSFFSKLFASKSSAPAIPPNVPKGLYLFGSVGCGKSFLMDLFYANLPAKFAESKRRVHFHAFMMDVHQRGHRLKGELGMEQDWIVHVAQELARDARVLCFDEFQVRRIPGAATAKEGELTACAMQVTDIADAMILRRLMESMMGYGVICVMTSKCVRPSDLVTW